jgi:YfiR/HmsC-like
MTHALPGSRGTARRGSLWRRVAPPWALRALLAALAILCSGPTARAAELPEYRLKAAFLYNFVLYTEWPAEVGGSINVCIHGQDPFGADIDELNGKPAAARTISVQRKPLGASLAGCQVVFIASSAMPSLARVLDALRGQPVLTVADSPGAGRQGVMLNMAVAQEKIAFEADLRSARAARLDLSSKLLRLATEVYK